MSKITFSRFSVTPDGPQHYAVLVQGMPVMANTPDKARAALRAAWRDGNRDQNA